MAVNTLRLAKPALDALTRCATLRARASRCAALAARCCGRSSFAGLRPGHQERVSPSTGTRRGFGLHLARPPTHVRVVTDDARRVAQERRRAARPPVTQDDDARRAPVAGLLVRRGGPPSIRLRCAQSKSKRARKGQCASTRDQRGTAHASAAERGEDLVYVQASAGTQDWQSGGLSRRCASQHIGSESSKCAVQALA
jgi:hypothetical protein